MAKVLVMTLRNEAGEEFNIRVRHPKDTLTAQEVQSVMDTIIAKSVFPTTGGDLTAKVGASIEGPQGPPSLRKRAEEAKL